MPKVAGDAVFSRIFRGFGDFSCKYFRVRTSIGGIFPPKLVNPWVQRHNSAMQVFRQIQDFPAELRHGSVTIGNFDGVHRGHRQLLERMILASGNEVSRTVLTFEPHPARVLYPERGVRRLFSLNDQIEQMRKQGVDAMIIHPFSREFSQTSAQDFFENHLMKYLAAKSLVIGHDFNFGSNREGNQKFLASQCRQHDVEFEAIDAVDIDEQVISSSLIRKLIADGDVAQAATLLGRDFYLEGIVKKGDQRGSRIGFPTANLHFDAETWPLGGVYVGRAYLGEVVYPSVANLGTHPTFTDASALKLEIHLLDQNIDLYGRTMRFEFIDRLREEKKFSGADELVEQIQRDIQRARAILNA